MTPLASDLWVILRRDLRCFMREVALFPDDGMLWRTVPGVTNSAGNLALHVAGNLRHFVGLQLGGIPYQRQRDMEFGRREGTRDEVIAAIEAALAAVELGLKEMRPESLAAPFPVPIGEHRSTTGRVLLHLSAHLAFHLGQAGYLRRALTGSTQSAGPLDSKELSDPTEV